MRAHTLVRKATIFAAAALAACGSSTGPNRHGPAALINVLSGDGQTAPVASVVPNPLVVLVTDAQSRPVPGVTVTWAVTAGNGVVSAVLPQTDSTGTATANFTVGTIAGSNEVTASVSGVASTSKFTVMGTPGPLTRVVMSDHRLALCKPGDQGNASATPTDQYGNTVTGTVQWVSRNPAVATVNDSGLVQLVSATGSTYVVASSGTAQPDSAFVAAAPPISMAAAQVDTALPASSFCIQSNQAGSEFLLAAFFRSSSPGATTGLSVVGDRLGTVGSGANVIANRMVPPTAGLQAMPTVHPDYAFEYALRERERREMPKYVASARAWYARMQAQRASGVRLQTQGTAGTAGVTTTATGTQQIPATTKVGDLYQLNTNANAYCSSPVYTTARVEAISNTAIVVADTTNPAGGFTTSDYQSFAAAMDTLVMPVDTTTFGAPSDIDNNKHVVIFFTKAVNALTTDPTQGIVLGFYYSRDLLPTTGTNACVGSNDAELFYLVVPDPNGTVNGGNSFTKNKQNVANIVVGTIGHEFQHLINASRRMYIDNVPPGAVSEETWLNEGLSHIAEELIFYRAAGLSPRQDIGTSVLSNPAVWHAFGLYMWGNQGRYQTYIPVTEAHGPIGEYAGDDELPTRAATWTFLRYLADHIGSTDGNFFYRLVNDSTTGLANLTHVLGADPFGYMRRWALSVYADGTISGIDPAYTQLSWNWPQVFALTKGSYRHPVSHTLSSSVPVSLTLAADGVAFFPFAVSNGQEGLITVTGSGGGALPSGVQLTLVRTK